MRKLTVLIVLMVGVLFFFSCEKKPLQNEDSVNIDGQELQVSKIDRSELSSSEIKTEYVDDMLNYFSDPVLAKYIEDIGNKLRTYKKENPNISNKQLDEYADNIVLQLASEVDHLKSKTSYDLYGYITNRLNSQEITLFNNNRAKGLICLANGKLAINYAEDNYHGYVLHNDNGDAFRHALWNYGMTIDVGSSFARQWSDAHEYGASGQPIAERNMDLYNNRVGINLGITNPNTSSHSTFISKTKGKVSGGDCIIYWNSSYYWSDSFGEK